MKVYNILTPQPACISAEATLVQAARHMKILDVGMLPVCDASRQVLGTVTDRDLAIRAVALELDPKTTTVAEIMSQEIISCHTDQEVADAAELMKLWQIRRLLVVDEEKKLVGIVSLGDLAMRTGETALAAGVLEQVSAPTALCEPAQLVA